MKRKLIFFVILLAFFIRENSKGSDTKEIFRLNVHKVVMLLALDENGQPLAIGSGFYVSNDGKIATNFHVIRRSRKLIVKENDQNSGISVTEILNIDYDRDLAIVKVNKKSGSVTFSKNDLIEVGDKIVAIGNPRGLSGTVSEGIVSGLRTIDENLKLIQITAPISPGSSGGPLFDSKGNVIGITTAYIEASQNLNFAVPASYIKALLSSVRNGTPIDKIEYENRNSSIENSNVGRKELDLVKIIDVEWHFRVVLFEKPDRWIEYSIYNGTGRSIKNVRILVVYYDTRNPELPVDSHEIVECEYPALRPRMSQRKITTNYLAPVYTDSESNFKTWWKAGFRVLDFEISED